jgi:ABC-type phosphate transport system auxiliary subunit
MQSSGQERIDFSKKLEKELNKKLHSITNTLPFMTMCGEVMGCHLSQVEAFRAQSQQLIDCLDLPNKDDTAAIANKKIEYEDRLDCMEDQMYGLWVKMKKHHHDLTTLTGEVQRLTKEFYKETINLANKDGGEKNG